MGGTHATATVLERIARDAQALNTLGAFRAKLAEALQCRIGAESAVMLDPEPWRPAVRSDADRIAGVGASAPYAGLFLANRSRYARSFARFLHAMDRGPVIDTDVYESSERQRLEVYAELFLPQRTTCILASAVSFKRQPVAIILLKRHSRGASFRSRHVEALRWLLPALALADAGFQYSLGAPALDSPCDANVGALSPRESQVAQLVAKGMRNTEVAALLGTSCETVKKQLHSAMGKVNVSNRTELAMVWAARGT